MYNTFIAATSLMFSLEKYQKLLMYHPDSRQLIFLLINYLINRLIVSALKHNGHLSAVALQYTTLQNFQFTYICDSCCYGLHFCQVTACVLFSPILAPLFFCIQCLTQVDLQAEKKRAINETQEFDKRNGTARTAPCDAG